MLDPADKDVGLTEFWLAKDNSLDTSAIQLAQHQNILIYATSEKHVSD